MSWVRKLGRQGRTHIISVPIEVVRGMGVSSGDPVHLESPFSYALTVVPLNHMVMAKDDLQARALGWLEGRARQDYLVERWAMRDAAAGCKCMGCGLHEAEKLVTSLVLCRMCVIELAGAMQFRQRPSQPELDLLRR